MLRLEIFHHISMIINDRFFRLRTPQNRQDVWKRQCHQVHGQHPEEDADHESGMCHCTLNTSHTLYSFLRCDMTNGRPWIFFIFSSPKRKKKTLQTKSKHSMPKSEPSRYFDFLQRLYKKEISKFKLKIANVNIFYVQSWNNAIEYVTKFTQC